MRQVDRTARSGTIIVGVLACLIVCMSMTSLALTAAMRGRREARLMHQRTQVELLCQAGVQRAVGQLASSAEYRGETWQPPLNVATYSSSEVEIEVKPGNDSAEALEVRVTARLNAVTHNFGPLQRTQKFQYTRSSSESETTQ